MRQGINAFAMTASSLAMEVMVVTKAMAWLKLQTVNVCFLRKMEGVGLKAMTLDSETIKTEITND